MQRVTVTLDDDLMAELDRAIVAKGYQNRSEALRDLARAGLRETMVASPDSQDCMAALVYVYDHAARDLSRRLVRSYHENHDLTLATMHVHLDHDNCMEVTVMRGATGAVQRIADQVIAERGVRHGRLMLIPVEIDTHAHEDAGAGPHMHVRVR